MSNWVLASAVHPDGQRDVEIGIQTDDSTGAMSGSVNFLGTTYSVTGQWGAAGSIPGRKYSAFSLSGADAADATTYLSAVGTMVGPGAAPESILININTASTANDEQYAWDGELLP